MGAVGLAPPKAALLRGWRRSVRRASGRPAGTQHAGCGQSCSTVRPLRARQTAGRSGARPSMAGEPSHQPRPGGRRGSGLEPARGWPAPPEAFRASQAALKAWRPPPLGQVVPAGGERREGRLRSLPCPALPSVNSRLSSRRPPVRHQDGGGGGEGGGELLTERGGPDCPHARQALHRHSPGVPGCWL